MQHTFFRSILALLLFSYAYLPAQITLIGPDHQAVNQNIITARLEWYHPFADSFDVFISRSSKFFGPSARGIQYNVFNTGRLSYSTTYFWKVRAYASGGVAAESPVWSFTTMAPTGEFGLQQEHGIIQNGIGYFQLVTGWEITAVDMKTLEKVWSYPFYGIYDVPPLIEEKKDGTPLIIVYQRNIRQVRALYLSDGETAWRCRSLLQNGWGLGMSSYTLEDGTTGILIPGKGGLYSLSVEDGRELWKTNSHSTYYGAVPAVDEKNGWAYHLFDHGIEKIDLKTGDVIKYAALNGFAAGHTNVVLADDEHGYHVSVAMSGKGVATFDADLNLVWQINTAYIESLTSLTYKDGRLFFALSASYWAEELRDRFLNDYKHVYAVSIRNGSTVWDCDLSAYDYAAISDVPYADGYLFALTDNAQYQANRLLFVIDAMTGELVQTLDYGRPLSVCGNTIISGGYLYENAIATKVGTGKLLSWPSQFGPKRTNHNTASAGALGELVPPGEVLWKPVEGFYNGDSLHILSGIPHTVRWNIATSSNVSLQYRPRNSDIWRLIADTLFNDPALVMSHIWDLPPTECDTIYFRVAALKGTREIVSEPVAMITQPFALPDSTVVLGPFRARDTATARIQLRNTHSSAVFIDSITVSKRVATLKDPSYQRLIFLEEGLNIDLVIRPLPPGRYRDTLRVYSSFGAAIVPFVAVVESSLVSSYQADVPMQYTVHPNYPNPFNPSTAIQIDMPYDGHVHLQIYDIRGALVATLFEGDLSSGLHRFVWNARSGYPSGIYFYRVTASLPDGAATRTDVRKMMLLK